MLIRGAEVGSGVVVLVLGDGARIGVPEAAVVNWAELLPPPVEPEAPLVVIEEPLPEAESPWREFAGVWADLIGEAASIHGLEPELLAAVAHTESNFNTLARSPKGACGLLQLMPATAARFGVQEIFDPQQNVQAGARYLSWLLERFDQDKTLALAGYNAGEGAVDRHRGVPPFRETQQYVRRVLERYDRLVTR